MEKCSLTLVIFVINKYKAGIIEPGSYRMLKRNINMVRRKKPKKKQVSLRVRLWVVFQPSTIGTKSTKK